MDHQKSEYFVSDNKSLLQIEIYFGVYQSKSNNQVGFARVVTDKATSLGCAMCMWKTSIATTVLQSELWNLLSPIQTVLKRKFSYAD